MISSLILHRNILLWHIWIACKIELPVSWVESYYLSLTHQEYHDVQSLVYCYLLHVWCAVLQLCFKEALFRQQNLTFTIHSKNITNLGLKFRGISCNFVMLSFIIPFSSSQSVFSSLTLLIGTLSQRKFYTLVLFTYFPIVLYRSNK